MSIKIYCTNNFSILGFRDSLLSGMESAIQEPLNNLQALDCNLKSYVGQNGFKVFEAQVERPYTKQLGPCIAIFAKAQDPLTKNTYLGLTHLYYKNGVASVQGMLKEIADKTQNAAIEIFIAGGWETSAKNYALLKATIGKENVRVTADLYGLVDHPFCATKVNTEFYSGDVGVEEAGFDADLNPYVIYGARIEGFNGDYKALKVYEGTDSS